MYLRATRPRQEWLGARACSRSATCGADGVRRPAPRAGLEGNGGRGGQPLRSPVQMSHDQNVTAFLRGRARGVLGQRRLQHAPRHATAAGAPQAQGRSEAFPGGAGALAHHFLTMKRGLTAASPSLASLALVCSSTSTHSIASAIASPPRPRGNAGWDCWRCSLVRLARRGARPPARRRHVGRLTKLR